MKKLASALLLFGVLVAGTLVWAAVCGTYPGDTPGSSCFCGSLTLQQPFCFGVTWNECHAGWFSTITITIEAGSNGKVIVGVVDGESSNIDFCKVSVDGSSSFLDVFNFDQLLTLSQAQHTLTFWSRAMSSPTDPTKNGNVCISLSVSEAGGLYTKRHVGWKNCPKPSSPTCQPCS